MVFEAEKEHTDSVIDLIVLRHLRIVNQHELELAEPEQRVALLFLGHSHLGFVRLCLDGLICRFATPSSTNHLKLGWLLALSCLADTTVLLVGEHGLDLSAI